MDAQQSAILTLGLYYSLHGYVRGPIPERLRAEGWRYHKGWEVRIFVPLGEFEFLRQVIARAGFTVAHPFEKRGRVVQPVYGREAVTAIVCSAGGEAPPAGLR